MHRLLILIAIGWGFWALSKHLKQQPTKERTRLLWKYAVYGLVLVIIALAATGKLHPLGGAIAALIPFIKSLAGLALRFFPVLKWLKQQPFANPVMTTRYLKVVVDQNQGKMSGEVLAGEHHGKPLAQLSQTELDELLSFYRQQDLESAQLLSAYMRQRFQEYTHEQQTRHSDSNMSDTEALQVLGLNKGASRKDIISAHRKLIQKLHPDRGGNDYLAAKINQAKDCLLKT